MNQPKISLCSKICNECGFVSNGTTDTLYAEAKEIMDKRILFPCHMYLKSQTGDESRGAELLHEVKVCRGYVAFMSLYASYGVSKPFIWTRLIDQLTDEDLENVYTPLELIAHHKGLREGIFLNNPIGSTPQLKDQNES